MTKELDAVLMKLGSRPVPAALDAIDDGIFLRLGNAASFKIKRGAGAATIAVAVGIGILGAILPSREAHGGSLTPLASTSPLSPAALLLGSER